MALRNDPVQPQSDAAQISAPVAHFPCRLGVLLKRNTVPSTVELLARPPGLRLQVVSVLHAAPGHAELPACLHSPACHVAHCLAADCSQYEVIALVLSSLAESPSLYKMSTTEGPPSLSVFSLASLPPHLIATHVCDLW